MSFKKYKNPVINNYVPGFKGLIRKVCDLSSQYVIKIIICQVFKNNRIRVEDKATKIVTVMVLHKHSRTINSYALLSSELAGKIRKSPDGGCIVRLTGL